jgi:hypothetical protein
VRNGLAWEFVPPIDDVRELDEECLFGSGEERSDLGLGLWLGQQGNAERAIKETGLAGYFLYTLNHQVFTQLTTAPTREQGLQLVASLRAALEEAEEEAEDEQPTIWSGSREALANQIVTRLARPDWYSDLSYKDASAWDGVVFALQDTPGRAFRIDFQCTDYGGIYWDCAEIAAAQGAAMMAEPAFGSSGFRYFGKPSSEYSNYPMYSLFTREQTRELLSQVERVEPHFRSLPEGEGSPKEQFFEGLLPVVREVVVKDRVLWVQTDT